MANFGKAVPTVLLATLLLSGERVTTVRPEEAEEKLLQGESPSPVFETSSSFWFVWLVGFWNCVVYAGLVPWVSKCWGYRYAPAHSICNIKVLKRLVSPDHEA